MKNWFTDRRIKTKLMTVFGIVIVFQVLMIMVSLSEIKTFGQSQKNLMEKEYANDIDLLTVEAQLNEARVSMYQMLTFTDKSMLRTIRKQISDLTRENNEIFGRLRERNQDKPETMSNLERLDKARLEFLKIRDKQTIPAILAGETEMAKDILLSIQKTSFDQIRSIVADMRKASIENTRQSSLRSLERIQRFIWILGSAGLLILLAIGGMTLFMSRTIAEPIKSITKTAERMAEGNLNIGVLFEGRKDEVGMLAQAFENMAASLQNLARAAENIADGDLTTTVKPRSQQDVLAFSFGIMAENLRGLVREIDGLTKSLHATSSDILTMTEEILSDMANIETTINETESSMRSAVATTQKPGVPEDWLGAVESSFQRIKHLSESEVMKLLKTRDIAKRLEESGRMLKTLVGQIRT